ncbi:MAG: hypothetical protein P4L86_09925 [Mycobacterium sp.]|nr:hypothetical protein [Mycobacterium sp.]
MQMWSRLRRVRLTLTYAVLLIAVTVTLGLLGPKVRDRVTEHASTNLHNLAHGRLGTLLGSAFIADGDMFLLWLPAMLCLLAAAELLWHSRRLLVVFAVGHVMTTLIVAAGLVIAVELGWLPRSISRVADVGVSYGVMAVVGALTAVVPARVKPAWIGWWLAGAVGVLVTSRDFTDSGHVVALVLGMLISMRLEPPARWTRLQSALFRIGVCFGYLVLVHTPELALVGVPASLLGATVTAVVSRWCQAKSSARDAAQSARQDSGG